MWEIGAKPCSGQRVGWRAETAKYEFEYYFTSAGWREATRGYDPAAIARAMIEKKLMLPSKDKASKSLAPPGFKKMRLYHIPPEALSYGPEPDDNGGDGGVDRK